MNQFARQQTSLRLRRFVRALQEATAKPSGADAIHDVRVASRRLQQCLITFTGFMDSARADKLRKRLKRLLDRCAGVRNCDIAIELLLECEIPARSEVISELKDLRAKTERRLVRYLERRRPPRSVRAILQRLFTPEAVDTEFSPDLVPWIKEWFARGDNAAAANAPYKAVHEFRLEGKRLRYTLELLRPLLGPGVEAPLAALRELQDTLGSINDCVATLELIRHHKRPTHAVQRLLTKRSAAFRDLWSSKFGKRGQTEWISIFSAMAKPNPGKEPSRKPAVPSPAKAGATSAA